MRPHTLAVNIANFGPLSRCGKREPASAQRPREKRHMSTRQTPCTIHRGSLEILNPSIDAPGLRFLAQFLPILDSLNAQPPVSAFVSPDLRFIVNRETTLSLAQLSQMFQMRAKNLQLFRHDVELAWQVEREGGRGWTVGFEGTSTTQFRGDEVLVRVAEMNVWELEKGEEGGLRLVEARCWMDPAAVTARAEVIFQQ